MSETHWLATGGESFPAMLDAIAAAKTFIRLEIYIYGDGQLGRKFLDALVAARQRGVRVRLLVDALGSWQLPGNFFEPLTAAGGEVQIFNPLRFWRIGVRNHRKLLVCDDRVVFVGGFNISDEYNGDGITRGWRDLGMRLDDAALAKQLGDSFDQLFELADFHRKPLLRLRGMMPRRRKSNPTGQVLLSQPGLGLSPFERALRHDLKKPREVRIISAYFLPPWRLRRALMRAARHGARVQIVLPAKSDVLVSQLAAQHLYRRLLRAGVEIYEYQPQILHAKLMVIDNAVYVGSSNLDIRSLKLNYELMLRFDDAANVVAGNKLFEENLALSKRIERTEWKKSRGFLQRMEADWAYFLLSRVDRWIALKQFKAVAD
jgi:cardiolipin synthase